MRTLLASFFLAVATSAVPAFADTAADQSMLEGPWRGVWTAPGPYEYQAEMVIHEDDNGHVLGQINWMLVRTPNPEEQSKISDRGIEYVEGQYDPTLHALSLEGTRVDDPHHILGPDVYRMIVTDDGQYMLGATQNGTTWAGRIELQNYRPQPAAQ
jgi:hypothetical protein